MSLCRWSNSVWYIYEPCGSNYTLEVCGFGQFTVVDILRNFKLVNKQAKAEGYTFLERLELRAYLTLWSLFRMKKMKWNTYRNLLNYLRTYSESKMYVENPYNVFHVKDGIPKELQIHPCFGPISPKMKEKLARLEIRRNSPLAKALRE